MIQKPTTVIKSHKHLEHIVDAMTKKTLSVKLITGKKVVCVGLLSIKINIYPLCFRSIIVQRFWLSVENFALSCERVETYILDNAATVSQTPKSLCFRNNF
jgi:hypothetical protein